MSVGSGGLGSGGLGASSTQQVEVTASMAGDSSMPATMTRLLEVTVSMAGEADFRPAPSVEVEADLSAVSSFSADPNTTGGSVAKLAGTSSMAAVALANSAIVSAMAGDSSMGGSADYATLATRCDMAGSSDLLCDATFLGAFGDDSYGGSPYGSAHPVYGIESATALSSTRVRIRYTAMFDPEFPLLRAISNYTISPPVTIKSIVLESAQSVLVNTASLNAETVYTVTISDARGYLGQPLYPPLNSAQFLGAEGQPSFYAVATGKNRVRAVFSEQMRQNAGLIDPQQYVLADLSGAPVTVTSVTAEQLTNVRSTVLHLGVDLVDERHYRLTILSGVVSQKLASVSPDTAAFQWVGNVLGVQIPVGEFSGEVQDGLFGIHAGLVFFSPALENSASNSIIQVEQVDVCTRAYDEYHFPQPIDPRPLMIHGAGLVPTPTVTTLNSADWVLWAGFPRLVEARFELNMTRLAESVPPPVDGPVVAILDETWPASLVSLLNDTSWKLFDNLGTPPTYFFTAANLTPFPPGGSVITILNMHMAGVSTQEVEARLGLVIMAGDSTHEAEADLL